MKLEKDRLIAKVDNLEANLAQLVDADGGRGPRRQQRRATPATLT
jgi:hypothetical protein